jgi:hypothetical protein
VPPPRQSGERVLPTRARRVPLLPPGLAPAARHLGAVLGLAQRRARAPGLPDDDAVHHDRSQRRLPESKMVAAALGRLA